jgi:hypothetical protein
MSTNAPRTIFQGSADTAPIRQHLSILGHKVEDKVTGFKGVVSSVSFDLYGCVQVIVTPPVNKDATMGESKWFDIARLTVTSKEPVLPMPSFTGDAEQIATGKKGPAEKPSQKEGPR